MNKMKEVAQLLGVELEEEFKMRSVRSGYLFEDVYRISHSGLELNYNGEWCSTSAIGKILSGEYEIIKRPWKPKHGETYWCIGAFNAKSFSFNPNDYMDLANYALGNCFRTEREAETNANHIRKKLKKMYDDGVQI